VVVVSFMTPAGPTMAAFDRSRRGNKKKVSARVTDLRAEITVQTSGVLPIAILPSM
jgi:hypothetical protein